MRSAKLEQTMSQLGWTFILALFFQVRIGDRSLLLPFFGVGAIGLLVTLSRYKAFAASTWFRVTMACAVIGTAAAFVALIPVVEPGTPSAVTTLAMTVGLAAYAGVLHDWSVRQGWEPPAAKARTAQTWLAASAGILVVALAAFVISVDPGPASDEHYSPSTILGRPLEGWAPLVVLVVVAVTGLVGVLKLRKASQLIRHSLRAQPDAELVNA
ncbi:MAG: hypothetical protein ACTHN0_09100 [Aquihabitans sp.]